MMRKTIFALAIAFAASILAAQEPEGLKRFAIIAGSNDGGNNRVMLQYAETDALSMYSVLSEIGGLSSSNTILLKNPLPEDLQGAFESIRSRIEKEGSHARRTEFIFYYSGHSDEMGILPGGNLYAYSDLRNMIDSMGTDVKIAVLDSCSSGAFTRLKGGVKKAPFMVDESVDTKGHAFLTSSSENEAAQESDSIEGSFFTHFLISALRGAADNTGDGTVSLNEAYSFAADETLARTTSSIAGAQHPSYSINLTGSGDLVLTDLREVVSSIAIAEDIDGRIFFRDSKDRLVIEFRKRAGVPVALSLPSGVYNVELERESGLSTATITVSRGLVQLEDGQFKSQLRTQATVRGDDGTEGISEPDIYDRTEASLEDKMDEIRSIINDKFGNADPVVSGNENAKAEPDDFVERTDLEYSVFGFSPTPSYGSANDVRNISVNFIGKPYAINGIAIGFMNFTYADVYGTQIGALSNTTGRDNFGLLASGIYNIVGRDLWGVAASGIFNINEGSSYGLQTAGIFNITSSESMGVQASGIFNISEGVMYGVQASGIFNIAGETLNGGQFSGIFNVSNNVNGVQASLINIGHVVNGVQIGLININDDINGLPIGLITISKNGIMDFGGWYENSGFFYTGLQTGSKNFYNFGYIGFPVKDIGPVLVAGLGIGSRINFKPFYIDIDASVKSVAPGFDYGDAVRNTFSSEHVNTLFPNARIAVGLKMFRVLSLYGGMSLDMYIPSLMERSDLFHNYTNPWIWKNQTNGSTLVEFHPKWYAGLKINL